MLLISFFVLLLSRQYGCFYVNTNLNQTVDHNEIYEGGLVPEANELRSQKSQFVLFGKTIDVPYWMSNAVSNIKEAFSEFTGPDSGKKVGGNLLARLRKDQSMRIWLAVYLNIFVVILVYVFITVKLILLSMKENEQERRKRKTSSSHAAYDAPDYNLPLASIATRPMKPSAPSMSLENPVSDYLEMAREVSEEYDELDDIIPIEMGPSTSTGIHVDPQIYDNIPETESLKEDSF